MDDCEGRSPLNNLPSDVSAWWVATGSAEFAKHPATLILPPPVYPWWEATGSAQFAASVLKEVPGLVITGSLDSVPPTTATGQTPAPTSSPGTSLPGPGASVGASAPQPTQLTTSEARSSSIPKTSGPKISIHPTTIMGPNPTAAPATKMEIGSSSASAVADAAPTTFSTPSNAGNTTLETPAASLPTASSTPSQTQINAASHSGKSPRIVAGLVTPLVLLLLLVVALALYKRRQRARDRREWERTDEAIADDVRQVGGTPAAPWT